MVDRPRYNWMYVNHTECALRAGQGRLENVPGLLKIVLREECWREYLRPNGGGRMVHFDSFHDFVTHEDGLGTTVDMLKRVCAGDTEVLDLLDQTMQQPNHRPTTESRDNVTTSDPNERGNSTAGALRRLRKDAPELHARVLDGELSAHAAMLKAGLRKRTISVRPEEPESTVRALRKHCTPEQRQEIARKLTEPCDAD